jgi:uncharacterized protein (UPF0147 family)
MMFSPAADQIPSIVEVLIELNQDSGIPKNVKFKLNNVISILKGKEDASVKANKALVVLDEVNEDSNVQTYLRTDLLNVVSMLSKIN